MSSSIRIKVQVGEDKPRQKTNAFRKFIYVIDSPGNQTIDELIRNLQDYISQKFSLTKTQLVELQTIDGYLLSRSDRCSQVLKDNEQILCIDMQKFIEDYSSKCKDTVIWLELKQHDASDNRVKSIQIGLNNFSELFLRMYGAVYVSALYVFGIHELVTIAREKRKDNLIARLDSSNDYDQISPTDWFLETRWEYDAASDRNLFILCHVKVASDDEVRSEKLQIILDTSHMRVDKGEITHLSGASSDHPTLSDQRLKELAAKLPPVKRTGPQISLHTNENIKLSKHECEGESTIRMTVGNSNTFETFQDRDASDDGTFGQNFVMTHIIFSKKPLVLPEILQQKRSAPADKPVSVASLTVFYQIYDGSWRECEDVAIAPIAMRNEEPKWLVDSVINIEPDKLLSFTIKGRIIVKGEPGGSNEVRERIHKSLPQPLKLKIIVTDNFSRQCSLVLEQLNRPLELLTRESYLKTTQSSILEFLAFVYADDCDTDERVFMTMYVNTDHRLTFRTYERSYMTYDRRALRMMEYNAKQNRTTEMHLKQVNYERYTQANKAFVLFEPETFLLYAIRLEVSTKTSKTEETILIPMEKIK